MTWVKVKNEVINLSRSGGVRCSKFPRNRQGSRESNWRVSIIGPGGKTNNYWDFRSQAAAQLLFEKLYSVVLGNYKVEDLEEFLEDVETEEACS